MVRIKVIKLIKNNKNIIFTKKYRGVLPVAVTTAKNSTTNASSTGSTTSLLS